MLLWATWHPCRAGDETTAPRANVRDADAVRRVQAGKEPVANAAWWGFDPQDATEALQGAIRSGAKRVLIPYMGTDWNVRPIMLASDQEIIFEPGVVVAAKKGEFLGEHDALFWGNRVNNVTLNGYGATLRMRKADYTQEPYKKAEWRHTLVLTGVSNVVVLGLRLERSGGDGILLGTSNGGPRVPCRKIYLRDLVCDENHRQGISVISAEHLRIENCTFSNTRGTAPQAGIDFEPDYPDEFLSDIEIKNCLAVGNAGNGFTLYLGNLDSKSPDVSVRFVNCRVRDSGRSALMVLLGDDDAPGGLIEFDNCTCETLNASGLMSVWNPEARVKVRLKECKWRDVAPNADEALIHFELGGRGGKSETGGIEFVNCHVYDEPKIGFLRLNAKESDVTNHDVSGTINVVRSRDGATRKTTVGRTRGLQVNYYEGKR